MKNKSTILALALTLAAFLSLTFIFGCSQGSSSPATTSTTTTSTTRTSTTATTTTTTTSTVLGWKELAPMSNARFSASAAEVNGLLYVNGGSVDFMGGQTIAFEMYDPASGNWTAKTPFTDVSLDGRYSIIAPWNGLIYLVGWLNAISENTLEVYTPATGSWAPLSALPYPLVNGAIAARDGKIYQIGGNDIYSQKDSVTVEVYDIASNTWTISTASLNYARGGQGSAAVVVGTDIYVCGAATSDARSMSVEKFDGTNWTVVAPMHYPHMSGSYGVRNNKIYVFSGLLADSQTPCGTAEIYDPAANQWTEANINPPNLVGSNAVNIDNKLYTAGGILANGSLGMIASLEVYGPLP